MKKEAKFEKFWKGKKKRILERQIKWPIEEEKKSQDDYLLKKTCSRRLKKQM